MAQMLAVDWTQHEIRYVSASASGVGHKLKLSAVQRVPLRTDSDGDESSPPGIGEHLAESLAGQKLGRGVVLVAIDRAGVEVLEFTLPPATNDELPELVSHQAMRESPTITDDSVIDFVANVGSDTESRKVTAFALSREQRQQTETICETAGLEPTRLLWRPFATASLYLLKADDPQSSVLLVNLVDDELDLIVCANQQAVYTRTVRLPSAPESEDQYRNVLAEINRTMMLVPHDEAAAALESVCIFGQAAEHQPLLKLIREQATVDVSQFDAFTAVGASDNLLPDDVDSGRFASLLGMLWVEEQKSGHTVDFLNPRKKPTPPDRKRTAKLIGGVLAAALSVCAFFVWETQSEADARNDALQKKLKKLDKLASRAKKQVKVVDAIAEWNDGNVVWLDELHSLSQKFPGRRDAVVLKMAMTAARGGGGNISLQGLARDPLIVERMEQDVRDARHEVRTPRVRERTQENNYTWHFETSVAVSVEPIEEEDTESAKEKSDSSARSDKQSPREPVDNNEPLNPMPNLKSNAFRPTINAN